MKKFIRGFWIEDQLTGWHYLAGVLFCLGMSYLAFSLDYAAIGGLAATNGLVILPLHFAYRRLKKYFTGSE